MLYQISYYVLLNTGCKDQSVIFFSKHPFDDDIIAFEKAILLKPYLMYLNVLRYYKANIKQLTSLNRVFYI